MPIVPLARRLRFHLRRSRVLRRTASRLHARAKNVAARALAANWKGYRLHARRLVQRALRLKARAARTGLRAAFHANRVFHLRARRRQLAVKRAA